MNEKFTTGPWKWSWEWTDHGARYIGIENSNFEEIIGQNGLYSEDDANLIAAAPDMYEALEDVVSKIEDFLAGKINIRDDYCYKPRKALAKARGE